MGIGNFFDNFISGLAFGIAVSNPFSRGMCCYGGYGYGGFGYGYGSPEIIDFGTFGNSFPNVFGNITPGQSKQPITLLNDFTNSGYPSFSFSQVGQSIWDYTLNPESEFNKRLKEYNEWLKNQKPQYSNTQTTFNGYDMPFSSWYLPTQINYSGFGFMPQYTQLSGTTETKPEEKAKDNKPSLEPGETDSDSLKNTRINYDITALKSKWSKKKDLPDAFYDKVIHISKKIKCDPDDLMGVMWVESAKTFSPSVKNPKGAATGLIQFMPDTARTLGTTIAKLKAMTAVEQLDYVEKFLVANKSAAGYKDSDTIDRGTLYSLVFLPGRSKRAVLTTRGESYYDQNTVLDYNNDGKITKADLASIVTDNMA